MSSCLIHLQPLAMVAQIVPCVALQSMSVALLVAFQVVCQAFCCRCCCLQTPDHLKTSTAEEAFNPNGLSQRTIRLLKDAFPDVEVRGVGDSS
jgi:delta-aminolevulinic acid dehydratase/porphobilinogen synthase